MKKGESPKVIHDKECPLCKKIIDPEDLDYCFTYWANVKYSVHKDCKKIHMQKITHDCQEIDANCNDCINFKRLKGLRGYCSKYGTKIETNPNSCEGHKCFKHRKGKYINKNMKNRINLSLGCGRKQEEGTFLIEEILDELPNYVRKRVESELYKCLNKKMSKTLLLKTISLTDDMYKQLHHEPTKEYFDIISSVVEQSKYKRALEIGSAWGVSTLAILFYGKGTLLSIDKNSCPSAEAIVKRNNWQKRWKFIKQPSELAVPNLKETFDFIFIDGSHLYDNVRADVVNCWRILNKGGIMLIDDYGHKKNNTNEYGVKKAVDEFCDKYKLEKEIIGQLVKITK